jgi:hypothetical protein
METNNYLFLKNALGMVGDPSPLLNQYVSCFTPFPRLTGGYRWVSELIICITYVLSMQEATT